MLKKIIQDDREYYFNRSDGNFYDVSLDMDPTLDLKLDNYFKPEVISFFQEYDYAIIKKVARILKPDQIYLYKKRYYENLKQKKAEISDENFLKNEYDRISVFTINLTERCNLKCKYCFFSGDNNFRREHSSRSIDFDKVRTIVDFLAPRMRKAKRPNINFYGGEPLLEFGLMKRIVDYVKARLGNKILLTLTTNGTLITDHILEYLVNNNIAVALSIDGSKDIHDGNRRFENDMGTFDNVFHLIRKIHDNYHDYFKKKVAFSTVISADTDIDEFYNFFSTNRILFKDNLFKISFENTVGNEKRWSSSRKDFVDKILDYYLERLMADADGFNILSLLFKGDFNIILDKKKRARFLTDRLCFPGRSRLFLDADGNLFPCESLDYYAKIGDCQNGFDYSAIKKLMLDYIEITKDQCFECWAFPFCRLCYFHAIDKDRLSLDFMEKSCNGVRAYFERMIKLVLKICEEKGDNFLKNKLKEVKNE